MPSRTSKEKAIVARLGKRVASDVPKDEEELALESALFGGQQETLDRLLAQGAAVGESNLQSEDELVQGDAEEEEQPSLGFVIDTTGDSAPPAALDTFPEADAGEGHQPAAWIDEETENISVDVSSASAPSHLRKLRENEDEKRLTGAEYEARLRRQFERINPVPKWAAAAEDTDLERVEDNLAFLKASGKRAKSGKSVLGPDLLDIQRMGDANRAEPSKSVVSSVKFHPTAPILMTAGLDKTLRLFQVDGKDNEKLSSIYLGDLPISKASFACGGTQVICTGRRRFLYTYDLESGTVDRISHIRGLEQTKRASGADMHVNFSKHYVTPDDRYLLLAGRHGHVIMLSMKTKQWIATLKMNSECCDVSFSQDGQFAYSFGADGDVYKWDLNSRVCVSKFFDQGAVRPGVISLSPDETTLATGTSTGVVNLYDSAALVSAKTNTPNPRKSIMNLTTSVTGLAFHPSSQILAMASRAKRDSLKVLHVPSGRVYSNWPTERTPLGYIQSLDFSPGGGYMCVGNDKGRALLFKLNHFEEY